MKLINQYLKDFEYYTVHDYIESDVMLWYVGENLSVDQGIQALYKHLDKHGEMLDGDMEIMDYTYDDDTSKIIYVILNFPVSKLGFIQKQYERQLDKNVQKRSKL